jgi:integrase
LTITELAIAYVKFATGFYVKNGKQTNEVDCIKSAVRIVRNRYGDTSAATFSPLALKAIQQAMIDEGWSRGFINRQIGRVKRMFRWAVSEAMIPVATWQTLTAVTGLKREKTTAHENSPVGPVDDAVVEATLPYLPPVIAAMVRLQRLTGCRPGEVCIVRPCDIDTSGKVWSYRPASHKTEHFGRERIIFIGPKAQDVLRPYLLRATDAFCFIPRHARSKGFYDSRTDHHAIRRGIIRINRDRLKTDKDAELVPHWHAN